MEEHDPKIIADSQVREMQVREEAVACTADARTRSVESSHVNLGQSVRSLFNAERNYVFEDGMESEFSRGLEGLIRTY